MKKIMVLLAALSVVGTARATISAILGDEDVGVIATSAPGFESANGIQILAVPFAKCMGNGAGTKVMLGSLVSTLNLTAQSNPNDKGSADQLIVLTTNGTTAIYYYYWLQLDNGAKVWSAMKTTLLNGTEQTEITPPAASAFEVARGEGFWLKRPLGATSVTLYLKGQVATANDTVAMEPGLNLMSLGAVTNCALNSAAINWGTRTGGSTPDKLMVVNPDGSGSWVQYIYSAGKWLEQSGEEFIETTATVAPGQGFWYVRRGTSDLTFTPVAH
jgi:hypothetical protein